MYYIPPEDIKMEELTSAGSKSSYCEWKVWPTHVREMQKQRCQ